MTEQTFSSDTGAHIAAAPPRWFAEALAMAPVETTTVVDGGDIALLRWGGRDLPGLVFVPGMLAHAHWWSFIAPFFVDNFQCLAVSLSGMGGSDFRHTYSTTQFTNDLDGAIKAAGLFGRDRKPMLIAHSFGGIVARRYAERFRDSIAGLILIDSPVRSDRTWRPSQAPHPQRRFASQQEAIDRFSLKPSQPCENRYLLDYIARKSLAREDGHFTWSFDPQIRVRMDLAGYDCSVGSIDAPIAFVWGEDSSVCPPDMRAEVEQRFPQSLCVTVPCASHHVMLDQPLALVTALRTIIAAFGHTP